MDSKRILYIANARIPTEKAHGIQIMKMCEAFAELGHDITLVVPQRQNVLSAEPFGYYGLKKNFTIVHVPCIDSVSLGRLGFLLEAFSFAWSVHRFAAQRSFDLLYSRDEIPLWLLSFGSIPIVFEAHEPRFNMFIRRIARRVRRIIVISGKLATFLSSRGVPTTKIMIAHDGVDLDMFSIQTSKEEARKKLGLPLDKKIVLYAGHIYPWKGAGIVLQTGLRDEEIVIVGKVGDYSSHEPLNKNVNIRGVVSYTQMPLYMRAADCAVLTGLSNTLSIYSSPLKLFEYMASGVPMVVADLPSFREIVNNDNAFLFSAVDNNDSSELEQAIKKALYGPDGTLRAMRAREDVVGYTWQKRALKILGACGFVVSAQ